MRLDVLQAALFQGRLFSFHDMKEHACARLDVSQRLEFPGEFVLAIRLASEHSLDMNLTAFVRPEQRPSWQTLQQLAHAALPDLGQLLRPSSRATPWCFDAAGITLDISRQRVNEEVFQTLLQLAQESSVAESVQSMCRGDPINTTEGRPALHVALRGSGMVDPPWGTDISQVVQAELNRFLAFAERVRAGQWLGATGKPITDVVNLGIGGSDLGPRMVVRAMRISGLAQPVRVHFVSNADALALQGVLQTLHPERTGFIIQSKSFTTPETMLLAQSARRWLSDAGLNASHSGRQLVAVTAQAPLAAALGIPPEQTFHFWDWVGGRYSVWSAIGLPVAIAMGGQAFRAFLAGAHDMDEHARTAAPALNLPVIMALMGIWNGNFLGATNLNIAPYAYALAGFVPYLQQLEMESNGKSTHLDGSAVKVQTAPLIWGGLGIEAQHAYFQLIHQGAVMVPMDFIGVRRTQSDLPLAMEHHQMVLQNMQAQAQALAVGRDREQTLQALRLEGLTEAEVQRLTPFRIYPGNNPSSMIWLDALTPRTLGALMALYEHKVFVQSVIWGINPFDQWGVELGKTLLSQMKAAPPLA